MYNIIMRYFRIPTFCLSASSRLLSLVFSLEILLWAEEASLGRLGARQLLKLHLQLTHLGSSDKIYSRVPNKRPGTCIYFQENASLYGPYLALYVYSSLYILARQFLRKETNPPNLVVNKSWYLYNLSLGRLLEGDPLECCLLIQSAGTGSD